MDSKKKIKALGTKERMEVIKTLDDGASVGDVCKDFNISKSQVYRIKGKRKQIEEDFNLRKTKKRHRRSNMVDIDQALKVWFDQMMAEKGTQKITGPMLQQKALELYKEAAKSRGENVDCDFKISASWIQRWRERNKVLWRKEEEEVASTDTFAASSSPRSSPPPLPSPLHFMKLLNTRIIADLETSIENSPEAMKKVSMIEAIHMVKVAWENVQPYHIINLFKCGGFKREEENEPAGEGDDNDEPCRDWQTNVETPKNLSEEEFEAMVNVDVELQVDDHDPLTEEEHEEEVAIEDDEEELKPLQTANELNCGLTIVRRFALESGLGDASFRDIESAIMETIAAKKPQTKITQFFKPK